MATKVVEFVDTFLVFVARGRTPPFIHLFHHIFTACYAFLGVTYSYPWAHMSAFTNLGVHSIMYFYFFVQGCSIFPTWLRNAFCKSLRVPIQVLQNIQHFYMTTLTISFLPFLNVAPMPFKYGMVFALIMYGSYVFLFGKMLWKTLIKKKQQ